jgi:hypothetical protein
MGGSSPGMACSRVATGRLQGAAGGEGNETARIKGNHLAAWRAPTQQVPQIPRAHIHRGVPARAAGPHHGVAARGHTRLRVRGGELLARFLQAEQELEVVLRRHGLAVDQVAQRQEGRQVGALGVLEHRHDGRHGAVVQLRADSRQVHAALAPELDLRQRARLLRGVHRVLLVQQLLDLRAARKEAAPGARVGA